MLSVSSFLLCYQLWDKPRAVTQPTGRRKGLAARVLAVLGTRDNTEWVSPSRWATCTPIHPLIHLAVLLPKYLLGCLARIG